MHNAGAWPDGSHAVLMLARGLSVTAFSRVVHGLGQSFGTALVVCANRPAAVLDVAFASAGLAPESVRFLDCVSRRVGFPPEGDGRTQYIESPTMLEALAMRTRQWLHRLPGRRFVVVDSVTTLGTRNGVEPTTEFVHRLSGHAREADVPLLLLADPDAAPSGLLASVRTFCDGTLEP